MMTAREILMGARALISDKNAWIQGTLQRDNSRFCAIGAINKVAGVRNDDDAYMASGNQEALEALAAVLPPCGDAAETVFSYNDDSDHDCVLAAFDAAIETTE